MNFIRFYNTFDRRFNNASSARGSGSAKFDVRKILILLGIVMCISGIFDVFWEGVSQKSMARYTQNAEHTTGIVSDTSWTMIKKRVRKTFRRRTTYSFIPLKQAKVEYTVNGEQYTLELKDVKWSTYDGQEVEIYYEAKTPSVAKCEIYGNNLSKGILQLVVGAFFLILGIYLNHKKTQEDLLIKNVSPTVTQRMGTNANNGANIGATAYYNRNKDNSVNGGYNSTYNGTSYNGNKYEQSNLNNNLQDSEYNHNFNSATTFYNDDNSQDDYFS